jgi:Cu/Ag efflux pump CusA
MIRALVALSVRHYGAVTALTLLALIFGSWGALQAPLDVFPEFVPSQVDIQTEAPGFAPQQVEELVTKQVENAVNGSAGLATLRSESIPGLSVVNITFRDGVDVHVARQGVAERLAELGSSLPAGVGTPKLSPLVSSTMDLLKIGLVSDKVDAYTLRDNADWIIKPRLLAVPGVARVIVFGGDVRQIQVFRKWLMRRRPHYHYEAPDSSISPPSASCCSRPRRSPTSIRWVRPWSACVAARPSCCGMWRR